MLSSVQIKNDIKDTEKKIDEMKHLYQVALKVEEQREFVRNKKELLNTLGIVDFPPSKIGSMAATTNLNDFFELISLHLGYPVSVPMEIGTMSISQLLIAVNIINDDERFQKYRGNLFVDDLVA